MEHMPQQPRRIDAASVFSQVKAAMQSKDEYSSRIAVDEELSAEDREAYEQNVAKAEDVLRSKQEDLRRIYDVADKIDVSGFVYADINGTLLVEEDSQILIVTTKELVQKAMDHASAFVDEEA